MVWVFRTYIETELRYIYVPDLNLSYVAISSSLTVSRSCRFSEFYLNRASIYGTVLLDFIFNTDLVSKIVETSLK